MGGNEDPEGRTFQNLLSERVGRPEVKVAPATRVQKDALVSVRVGGVFAQLGVKRQGGLVFRVLREGRILVNKKLVNCRPIQLVNLRETTELLKRKSGDLVVLRQPDGNVNTEKGMFGHFFEEDRRKDAVEGFLEDVFSFLVGGHRDFLDERKGQFPVFLAANGKDGGNSGVKPDIW